MRCNNCGWDSNAPQQTICEKCSEVLSNSGNNNKAEPFIPQAPTGNNSFKGTIMGASATKPFIDNPSMPPKKIIRMEEKICSTCQAPVRSEFTQCPYCQAPISSKNKKPIPVQPPKPEPKQEPKPEPKPEPKGGKTITHWDVPGGSFTFSLRKINRSGEPENSSLEFTEERVQLNRKNLEPGNKTITSKVQATIENREGRWYLVNNSELKSTFIQVLDNEDIELKDGVVIQFGNSGFVFESK